MIYLSRTFYIAGLSHEFQKDESSGFLCPSIHYPDWFL